ncbi:MAG: A/G-specific adenine glycosylase [Terriglobales bacterium]
MTSDNGRKFDGVATRRWRQRLLSWYDRNRRDLPWRQDRDPYRVWLSEIMLQQTRVSAVLEHYRRFLQRFPTVHKLASAREAAVLAAWSGLGYYRRARMMHAAAKVIVKRHRGEFPGRIADLRALPGVGRYTAAAIASIAFNAPAAVVDGNVERVLGRVFAYVPAGEGLWQTAEALLSRARPGDFNQAMMELGATVCLPRQPRCSACPVFGLCATRGNLARPELGRPELGWPEKERPKTLTRQQRRDICYALDRRSRSIFLVQRPKHASLMPGMWELPEIPAVSGHYQAGLTLRHSITVTDYTVHVMLAPAPGQSRGRWVPTTRIPQLPLTGLARKILRQAQVI